MKAISAIIEITAKCREVAERKLIQAADNPQGKLRISLPPLSMRLMPHLIAFQQSYPAVELELDFSDRLVNVIEEGFNAVMRIGGVQGSHLMMRTLNGFSHRLVVSPNYLKRRGQARVPADLAAHACLHYRYPSSGKLDAWPLVASNKYLNLDLSQTAVTNVIDPLLAMAGAGQGIACLTSLWLTPLSNSV